MLLSNLGSRTVFVSTSRTINPYTGAGIGYKGAGAYYGGFSGSMVSTSICGGGSGGSGGGGSGGSGGNTNIPVGGVGSMSTTLLDLYEKLSMVTTSISAIVYNYSVGNFEYVIENFTQTLYYNLSQTLSKIKQDVNVYPDYENIRQGIARSLEGLNKAVIIYKDNLSNEIQITNLKRRAGILDNMTELKNYLDSLTGSVNLFPDIAITSIAATLKPEIAIYIKLYGFPDGGVFESDKLAFALQISKSTPA